MLNFGRKESAQLEEVDNHIARSIVQFSTRVQAAIVAFALVRAARVLIYNYPEGPVRDALKRTCADYLEGRDVPRDEDGGMFRLIH